MRMLGIDPGLRITGYACVEGDPYAPCLVEAGVFRLGRRVARPRGTVEVESPHEEASPEGSLGAVSLGSRLAELERDLVEVIERVRPRAAAVESLFAHYKHPATAIVMGHARGVILLAIRRARLPIVELRPNEVKKSVTGNGHAGKAQMQRAVQAQFGLAEPPSPPDVADAIAIAVCAARRILRAGELAGAIRPDWPRTRRADRTDRILLPDPGLQTGV
ncbi:MAG: crossover junction endodeoxyribonuclease RuvC [Phycisphaeraceae bacterium]|nr:crossover junction endodeoxyribonuclease RuvC [Phycisphaerae bacterium]MBX3391444.1 crossover junction endodeoxyribonuclease RuvC [Phycisphaeraceae bacterium]